MSLDALYDKAVLRLAASLANAGRIAKPNQTVVCVNPLCGDRVTLDLTFADGRITGLGFELKACLLCQAAAAALMAVVGHDRAAVADLRAHTKAMLKSGSPPPSGPFAGFAALAPVSGHASRHACVLLPLDALDEALEKCASAGG